MGLEFQSVAGAVNYYEGAIAEGRMTEAIGTSEFSGFLSGAVKGEMLAGQESITEVWPTIATRDSLDNTEVVAYVGAGTPTGIKKVEEMEELPGLSMGNDVSRIVVSRYGGKLEISETLLRRDRTGEVFQRARNVGRALAEFRDQTWADFINAGTTTTIYDSDNLFANSHPNTTGGSANTVNDNLGSLGAISTANLETALEAIWGWQNFAGQPMTADPRVLLTASNQFLEAARQMGSAAHPLVNFSEGVVNVLQSLATPVRWPRLTTSTWYFVTNIPGLVHATEKPMTVRRVSARTGDWQSTVTATSTWALEEHFAYGARNWRAIYSGG